MRYIILSLLLTLSIINVNAHSIWIETAQKGNKGANQEIKVYFGAYESNKPDSTKKWFSNIEDFVLEITAPNGHKKVLTAAQQEFFFKANFTPDQEGTYLVSISHPVKDLYKGAKLQYYAIATIVVGNPKSIKQPENLTLSLNQEQSIFNKDQVVSQKLSFKDKALDKQLITIVDPDLVSIEVESDAQGLFKFTPKKQGKYFIEAFYEEDLIGKHNDQDFKKAWHMVTQVLKIN